MTFTVATEGSNRLRLAELCQRFANEQWLPAHANADEAAEMVLDAFRRAVAGEMELLSIQASRNDFG